jgi:hypothetical protein
MFAVVLLASCGGGKDSSVVDTAPATGTTSGSIVSASCVGQASNSLRMDCTVVLRSAGSVSIVLEDGRVFDSGESAAEHTLALWGLAPETTYSFTATEAEGEAVTGEFTTGPVPPIMALDTTVTGGPPAVGAVLVPSCGFPPGAVMLDGAGQVIWYQDFTEHAGSELYALSWTDEGTVLAELDHDLVVELSPGGELLHRFELAELGITGELHHDLKKRDGRFYLLYATLIDDLIVDRVAVLDADGALLGTVDTSTWYDTAGAGGGSDPYWGSAFPGSSSVSHANSVDVSADREIVVSFRLLEALVAADGDPDSPTFGEPTWVLTEPSNPRMPPTVTVESSVTTDTTFQAPHCASFTPSGHIGVLDNGEHENTRGLILSVDGGVAEIEAVYDLGAECPDQGSVFELGSGEVVLACASGAFVEEFAPGAATSGWRMEVDCPTLAGAPTLTRATPVDLTPR